MSEKSLFAVLAIIEQHGVYVVRPRKSFLVANSAAYSVVPALAIDGFSQAVVGASLILGRSVIHTL